MRQMKDSGIAWIGEIPEGWKVEQVGRNIKEVNCPNVGNLEQNALQFKMGTIISKKGGDSKYNPLTMEAYNRVQVGDVVINGLNLSFDLISQRVGLVKENGVITSTYLTIRPSEKIDSAFLTYLLKSYDNCKALHGMGRGLRATLAYRELRSEKIFYPSLPEQKAIADFLDTKCAEIDELTGIQEKFIDELKAYKQSLITETVTHGLNPHVEMKDSGVEWIGQIPCGWEVRRLKNHIQFINGYAFNSDSFTVDQGVRVIRIGDIGDVIDFEGCVRSKEKVSLSQYRIMDNDILIAMSGATTGKSCLTKNVPEAYINQRVGIIRSSLNSFLRYVLLALYIPEYISLNNAGSAQPNISASGIGNIPLVLPPLPEQEAIAAFLDTKCAEIDQLIAIKQQKIDELRDYKKSLIYEYVTGKKSVESEPFMAR